jgi:pimeloyl-ACP methyl ester carboxylesterase
MGAIVSALAFPHPPKDFSEDRLLARVQQLVILKTKKKNLRIPAIHIRRPYSKTNFTLIYSHGNAEDVGISLHYLDRMSRICDCSVVAYEYPGYSISDGEPSEENCYEAIDAAYDYVTTTAGIDPSRVVLFGRSLGTGPTVDLGSRMPNVAGVILQSPLESGIRCVIGHCSSYTLYPFDIFRNYSKVHTIQSPVFIMHGTDDKVVPCDNGRALYNQLQERPFHEQVAYEPLWMPSRGHNDMPQDICLEHCRRFLDFLQARSKK